MAVVSYGTRADLEQRISAQRIVQMFDDDGDGIIAGSDLETLTAVLYEASDIVSSLLLGKGYSAEQLELLKTDKAILRCWCDIAAQRAGERKPEWLNENGVGPYDAFGQRARAELKALSSGETRSIAEQTAGRNLTIGGAIIRQQFQFANDPNDPNDRYGPGGF